MQPGDLLTLTCERVVAGGDAIARDPDGKIVFVRGGLPSEVVSARLDIVRKDRSHATVVEVLTAAQERVAAPCRHVAEGCGGCDWQHITPAGQADFKAAIVRDALHRIAHIETSLVRPTIALRDRDYRTTVRAAVDSEGRLSLRRRSSHELVNVDGCIIAHPLVRSVLDETRFPNANEVTIRVGANSGAVLVIVDGDHTNGTGLPEGCAVIPKHERAVQYREIVHGKSLRISAPSFFQSHAEAPDVLVTLIGNALNDGTTKSRVADLYCGVGLFGMFIDADTIIGVESSRAAVRDAKSNLAGRGAVVVCANVEAADLGDCDAVIADPPRDGLGKRGLQAIVNSDPDSIVLVSCDPASGARDLRNLVDAGYTIESIQPVDQFPHTAHVEIVSVLRR